VNTNKRLAFFNKKGYTIKTLIFISRPALNRKGWFVKMRNTIIRGKFLGLVVLALVSVFTGCKASGVDAALEPRDNQNQKPGKNPGGTDNTQQAAPYTVSFRDENGILADITVTTVYDENTLRTLYKVPVFRTADGKTTPERANSVFAGWNDQPTGTGKDYSSGQILPDGKTSLILWTKWAASDQFVSIYNGLRTALNEITNALNSSNPEFDDEFVIGSGIAEAGLTNEQIAQISQLTALIDEANQLLQGTKKEISVTVENGNGTTRTEKLVYYYYNYNRMAEVRTELRDIRQTSPIFDSGSFVTGEAVIVESTETHTVHSVTVISAGFYQIELWGASGGHVYSKNNQPALGGQGGYTKGVVYLPAKTVLKFRIGNEGKGTASCDYDATPPSWTKIDAGYDGAHAGGWNGGGNGGASESGYAGGSGGGGATDVRWVAGAEGLYTASVNNHLNNTYDELGLRRMVAAGGGGAAQSASVNSNNWPGLQGGNAGKPGKRKGGDDNVARAGGTSQLIALTFSGGGATTGSVAGIGGTGNRGSAAEATGGGGGGYYGGEAMISPTVEYTSSGAGGSNYISADFQNTTTDLNPSFGKGRAKIKYVGTTLPPNS
jgi:hypothetical protein